jgi:hypothetical protein
LIFVGAQKDAPACPTELPESADIPAGNVTGAFECQCACGAVTGAKCTAVLDEYNGSGCPEPPVGHENLAGCRTPGGDNSFRASVSVTTIGSCAASGAFKSKADPAFDTTVRVCARPTPFVADGCASDELCVPDGVAPMRAHSCIANDDETQPCPAPWTFAQRVYDDAADTRACNVGSCTCDDPTGTTCTGKMKNFIAATTCQGPGPSLDLPVTTCVNASANTSQRVEAAPVPSGGSCNAHGAPESAGGVAGAGGGIVCCVP